VTRSANFNLGLRLAASAAMVIVTVVLFAGFARANITTISLILLLIVLGIAAAWGFAESMLASVLAAVGINYFFLPPVGTFTIADPHNWLALAAFVTTATTASRLSANAKRRAAEAEERRREMERLYSLGQAMLLSSNLVSTARDLVTQFVRIFEIPEAAFFSLAEGEVFRSDPGALPSVPEEELRKAANYDSAVVDRAKCVSVAPVRLGGQKVGSFAVGGRILSDDGLNAVCYLIAIGIERARSLEETSRVEATRQSEALKAALIEALAHDLKTPLTSIKGALTHLLGKQHAPEDQELLSLANEESDRLHRLVVEALEMARIEAGKLHPERRHEILSDIVAASLGDLEAVLEHREVRLDIPHGLPRVDVDFDIVRQGLKQLVDNAARYSPANTPITIRAEFQDPSVIVSVCDRGDGIADEDRARIFDKFFRGRNCRRQTPGTGLGLSIAKGIVEAHGGRLWVESEPGAGSVFSFSLPAATGGHG
jgi:two-component system, OmpR family, sensor histidine kinase KdpD